MNKMIIICLGVVLIGFLMIFVFKIPTGNLVPLGFLLICPLMHFLMMKDHKH